jgi:hypothetical protein
MFPKFTTTFPLPRRLVYKKRIRGSLLMEKNNVKPNVLYVFYITVPRKYVKQKGD